MHAHSENSMFECRNREHVISEYVKREHAIRAFGGTVPANGRFGSMRRSEIVFEKILFPAKYLFWATEMFALVFPATLCQDLSSATSPCENSSIPTLAGQDCVPVSGVYFPSLPDDLRTVSYLAPLATSLTVSLWRPFCRLRLITSRPSAELIRFLNPCLLTRLRLLG